ncbi:MAG: glycosyltransferase [Acidobacteria bacterium]|nr:glycosyltransferase [Acidobacteriota bacterium]
MIDWELLFLYYLPLAVVAGSCIYHLGVVVAATRFLKEKEPQTDYVPPVSILKPVSGIEPQFYETLSSYFQQEYPRYEIIFCLRDNSDAALWTIEMLRKAYPLIPAKVMFISDVADTNPKAVKLQAMVEAAEFEIVVISDADIRVATDYLRRIVSPLRNEKIGLVTCLYRGIRERGLNSLLEALSMSGDFSGQVLLGRMLGGMRFGLGATLATRKKQIAGIGGFAPWLAYLADDFILGNQIARQGYQVYLSHTVVSTFLPRRRWKDTFRQQLRWARTIKSCSPAGYPGLIFAYGVPLALLPFTAGMGAVVPTITLTAVLFSRWLAAWVSGSAVTGDPLIRRYFWMLPLRDAWALLIWAYSFLGNHIIWRNEHYRLERGGKLRRMQA